MQILSNGPPDNLGPHIVLIYGLGMIGSSIKRSLNRLDYHLLLEVHFDWEDRDDRSTSQEKIETSLMEHLKPTGRISFVWSAGNAGFHASQEEVERENDSFMETVELAQHLLQRPEPHSIDFHYVSSAGGLFEGQSVIGLNSIPSPRRPYGLLKFQQENVLRSIFINSQLAIYRPSSVFGPMTLKSRQGLINNLVHNGRNRVTTVLDAHVMSLRDYVFSEDIGNFVGKSVRRKAHGIHFLVSSRCSSIFEVVTKIERVLKLKLKVRYDENFGNHMNITFSEKVMPAEWQPSSLEVGLRQFLIVR